MYKKIPVQPRQMQVFIDGNCLAWSFSVKNKRKELDKHQIEFPNFEFFLTLTEK